MVLWAMRSVWWISSQMLAHSVKGVTVSPVLELRFVRAVGLPCRWDCQTISLFGLLLDESSASLPSNGKVMPLELGGVFSVSLVSSWFSVLLHSPPIPSFLLRFSYPLPLPPPPLHYFLHLSPSDYYLFFLIPKLLLNCIMWRQLVLHHLQMIKPDGINCLHNPWAFSICTLDVSSHEHSFLLLSGLSCPLWPLKLVETLNTGTWILMAWLCERYSHLLSI